MGNRISHKYRTDSAIGYAHDKANRMTTLANRTQGFDLAGNLTLAYSADRGTSYVYRWDHHNRLTGVYDSTNTTRKAAFTWDALGRRVETINDKLGTTTRYYYDGVNEIVEDNQSAARQRYYVHGISYVDERLMMYNDGDSRPYYYVLDRMFNVRALIDRAGAIVERIAYDGYGQPLIRESCGRGDMDNSSTMVAADATRFDDADANSIWDPRADLDDDGDVDGTDETLFNAKRSTWDPAGLDFPPGVAQAFSDVDNSYLFQGVPHFALDANANATAGKLMLNHHRARFADPVGGRWQSRDGAAYNSILISTHNSALGQLANSLSDRNKLYSLLLERPTKELDPTGLAVEGGLSNPRVTCTTTPQSPTAGVASMTCPSTHPNWLQMVIDTHSTYDCITKTGSTGGEPSKYESMPNPNGQADQVGLRMPNNFPPCAKYCSGAVIISWCISNGEFNAFISGNEVECGWLGGNFKCYRITTQALNYFGNAPASWRSVDVGIDSCQPAGQCAHALFQGASGRQAWSQSCRTASPCNCVP